MDNSLEKVVSRLEKDLIAMKTAQPTGTSSVRAYETLTNFVWDYDYTFTAANYNGFAYGHGFGITFTSRSQSAPFASVRLIAQVNGVRYNSLSSTNRFGGITNAPDNASIQVSDDIYSTGNLKDYTQDNTVKWVVNTACNTAGTNIKIKVIVTATDMGKIDIKLNQAYA